MVYWHCRYPNCPVDAGDPCDFPYHPARCPSTGRFIKTESVNKPYEGPGYDAGEQGA